MVKVTVQTEKRLKAITDLAIAIKHVAIALSQNVSVSISDNKFLNVDTGIVIDTEDEVTETKIEDTNSFEGGKKCQE